MPGNPPQDDRNRPNFISHDEGLGSFDRGEWRDHTRTSSDKTTFNRANRSVEFQIIPEEITRLLHSTGIEAKLDLDLSRAKVSFELPRDLERYDGILSEAEITILKLTSRLSVEPWEDKNVTISSVILQFEERTIRLVSQCSSTIDNTQYLLSHHYLARNALSQALMKNIEARSQDCYLAFARETLPIETKDNVLYPFFGYELKGEFESIGKYLTHVQEVDIHDDDKVYVGESSQLTITDFGDEFFTQLQREWVLLHDPGTVTFNSLSTDTSATLFSITSDPSVPGTPVFVMVDLPDGPAIIPSELLLEFAAARQEDLQQIVKSFGSLYTLRW